MVRKKPAILPPSGYEFNLRKSRQQLSQTGRQKTPSVFVGILREHGRNTQQQPAARLEHAVNLGEYTARVGRIFQHLSAQDQVKSLDRETESVPHWR